MTHQDPGVKKVYGDRISQIEKEVVDLQRSLYKVTGDLNHRWLNQAGELSHKAFSLMREAIRVSPAEKATTSLTQKERDFLFDQIDASSSELDHVAKQLVKAGHNRPDVSHALAMIQRGTQLLGASVELGGEHERRQVRANKR